MRSFASRISTISRNFCSSANDEVLLSKYGSTAIITLNKPKVLNSLNINMIKLLRAHVSDINSDSNIRLAIMKGAGGKAFCAGGDVKTIYNQIISKNEKQALEFFTTEYKCDYEISSMNPIQISIFNGIVMGGGVGVSINAPIKIASENSVFAMPESKIGLFTDVGASYFLPRLKSRIGYYLGLTSRRLKGKELVSAGVATHFVPNSKLEQLEAQFAKEINIKSGIQEITKIIEAYAEQVPESLKEENRISHYFSGSNFKEIYNKILNADDEFGKSLIADISSGSPLSLRIIHEMLEKGKTKSLKECLQMDSHLCVSFAEKSDFVEGVRALLIEKDNAPKWMFEDPLSIPDSLIDSFFEEKGEILF